VRLDDVLATTVGSRNGTAHVGGLLGVQAGRGDSRR
jgi:hypothetical protein